MYTCDRTFRGEFIIIQRIILDLQTAEIKEIDPKCHCDISINWCVQISFLIGWPSGLHLAWHTHLMINRKQLIKPFLIGWPSGLHLAWHTHLMINRKQPIEPFHITFNLVICGHINEKYKYICGNILYINFYRLIIWGKVNHSTQASIIFWNKNNATSMSIQIGF